MECLKTKYGYCTVPKGTYLYRGIKDDHLYEEIFFATKFSMARSFGHERVQVWQTTAAFDVPFLISHLHDFYGKATSSLPELYYDVYPNAEPNLDDLDVKQDWKRRTEFAGQLFNARKILGWFSSIENNDEVELCLFNKTHYLHLVQFVEELKNQPEYYVDALRKIKVYPSTQFYERSTPKIKKASEYSAREQNQYQLFRKYFNHCVKDYIERGGTKKEGEDMYYNLRIKLKI
jgi:hypothetical protein